MLSRWFKRKPGLHSLSSLVRGTFCPALLFLASPVLAQELGLPRPSAPVPVRAVSSRADAIVAAARKEAEKGTPYIMEYHVLKYPNGDVPADTGVCTDLVVRALRAVDVDLQKEVHKDITANRSAYPRIWDRKAPDRNIDHRRCPNLVAWMKRHMTTVATSLDRDKLSDSWKPGDIVFFVQKSATHPWHVAIVSDKTAADGMPMLIDSYPPATSESHRLDEFGPIHSHFRIRK